MGQWDKIQGRARALPSMGGGANIQWRDLVIRWEADTPLHSKFNVTSLFTNVLLDKTIEIILERVYQKKEITATIPECEMKERYLCTKNVCFSFNNEIYIHRMMV